MPYKYLIAIDGGGTKTKGTLFTWEGEVVQTAVTSFSNFSVHEDLSKEHIEQLIGILRKSVPHNERVFVQMGIAGASKLKREDSWLASIQERFDVGAHLENDAVIALYSVDHTLDETVLLTISGTGSVHLKKVGQTIELFGGYGHLFGDPGSSYHLGLSIIERLLKAAEKTEPQADFDEHMIRFIGRKERPELIRFAYDSEKNTLAQLSKEVARLALLGDQDAITCLKKEGELLAIDVIRAAKTIPKGTPYVLAFRGGFIQNAPYVKDRLMEMLKDALSDYRFESTTNDPIIGAYRLGLINANKEVDYDRYQ